MRYICLCVLISSISPHKNNPQTKSKMKCFATIATILGASALASAAPQLTVQKIGHGPSTLVRAPAHDSASIESHRFGGNFAYATAEAHAFASVTPEISRATFPVSETIHTQEAPVVALVKKAPIVNTHHVASPVLAQQAVLAKQAVVGPIAHHVTVEQPLQKVQTVQHHVSQPAVHQVAYAQAAPVAYAQGAPVAYAQGAYAQGYAQAPLGYAQAPLGYAQANLAYAPQPIVA